MKIHVNRIPLEGLQEETSYDPQGLDLDRDDVHVEEPIALSAFVTRSDKELIVRADIRCELKLSCARCLTEFVRPLQVPTTLNYHVAPTDVVDLTEDIRQEIILAYPMIPLCKADCKGLCAVCGQNLNVQACSHQRAAS